MKIKLGLFVDGLGLLAQNPHMKHSGGKEYELCCDPSLLKLPDEASPSIEGLLKFLNISGKNEVTFVILNSKIVFSNVPISDGDHVELLSAIDGG